MFTKNGDRKAITVRALADPWHALPEIFENQDQDAQERFFLNFLFFNHFSPFSLGTGYWSWKMQVFQRETQSSTGQCAVQSFFFETGGGGEGVPTSLPPPQIHAWFLCI